MKKFLLVLGILFLGNIVMAQNPVLTGGVEFDWVNMSQVQRDEAIENYQNILFGDKKARIINAKNSGLNIKMFWKMKISDWTMFYLKTM